MEHSKRKCGPGISLDLRPRAFNGTPQEKVWARDQPGSASSSFQWNTARESVGPGSAWICVLGLSMEHRKRKCGPGISLDLRPRAFNGTPQGKVWARDQPGLKSTGFQWNTTRESVGPGSAWS
ncbi:uncharacterized protein LOC119593928 [Penaeus monodon]|uniref:uncharacterized protein LOC119593928 n=1 Tax=Penaeus monodon TaxID=6687 RepID=UPI0018A71208|nr:uncharacterized protein LOC119593928 [Penaeus monodon]